MLTFKNYSLHFSIFSSVAKIRLEFGENIFFSTSVWMRCTRRRLLGTYWARCSTVLLSDLVLTWERNNLKSNATQNNTLFLKRSRGIVVARRRKTFTTPSMGNCDTNSVFSTLGGVRVFAGFFFFEHRLLTLKPYSTYYATETRRLWMLFKTVF